MSTPSRPRLRSSQSISDLSSNSTDRPMNVASPPALPGSMRKISKNYHPYLVQTTASSLLTRSPSHARPHEAEEHRARHSVGTFTLPDSSSPGTTLDAARSAPLRLNSPDSSGEGGVFDIRSRKKGALWQEWEDRTRRTSPPRSARRLRKAQSAWNLSPTRSSQVHARALSAESDTSIPSVPTPLITTPPSSECDAIPPPAPLLSPYRRRSQILSARSSLYGPLSARKLSLGTESSADESDAAQWPTERKVTLRARPRLVTDASPLQVGATKEQLEALERKFAALAAGFERLEGFLHPAEGSRGNLWASITDEQIAAAGLLLFVGMGLGVVLDRVMSRR